MAGYVSKKDKQIKETRELAKNFKEVLSPKLF